MKILLDNFIFELQYAGGISKVWFNLIKRLKEKNNSNISFIEGNQLNNLFRRELNLKADNIISDKTGSKLLRRFLSVDNNDCDIYHSSYFRPLKNKGNSKVIVTVHDFIYEKYSGHIPKTIHIFLKKRALKQADAIICVSEHTRQDFYKYYPEIDRNSVHVVHNGVDELYQPIKTKDTLKIKGLTLKKGNFLLYVGNRGYCKNFPFIIKLMNSKSVKDRKLHLICVGGGHPSEKENKQLEGEAIQGQITFLSDISSLELNELYNYAHTLLFPSIYEGFGIPAIEAMKTGCPIWSTNSSSVKEILGSDYPISFDPTNWDQALSTFELLCTANTRERARVIGLEQSKKFSWNKCSEETYTIYNNLLNNE